MGFQDLIQKYEENTVLRMIVNLIPRWGGSLDVALTNRWSQIKQRRAEELLNAITEELKGIQEKAIKKEYLESEEFYDLIYQVCNNALANRCPETRRAYAKVVKTAILNEDSTANLEDIIRQIEEFREKDIEFLRAIMNVMNSGRDMTGETLSLCIAGKGNAYDFLECERMLYRFENLGLLDHPRNMLTKQGTMAFHKLPLYDKLVSYLGL